MKYQDKALNPESEKRRKAKTETCPGKGKEKGKSESKDVDSLRLIKTCLSLSEARAWTPFPAIVVALYAITKTSGFWDASGGVEKETSRL